MPEIKRRVGFWMTEKKLRKLGFSAYCDRLKREHGIEMVLLDLAQPLSDQGPFDLILHKLTDIMAAAAAGDEWAREAEQRIKAYFRANPDLRVLDSLEAVRTLTDRNVCYTLMRKCSCTNDDVEISAPNFVTIFESTADRAAALREGNVQFPVVCKPLVAHGSDLAHKMSIIFNEDGLKDMQTPCVAQQFVNHGAVLYKVFVIGSAYYVVQRPSIKNLEAGGHETIFFDSHNISKATSDSYLTQRDGKLSPFQPNDEAISMLVTRLRKTLSLALFGVDVIIENGSFRHMFIDINYFPGYDGMPGMFDALTDLLKAELNCIEPPRKLAALSDDGVAGMCRKSVTSSEDTERCCETSAGLESRTSAPDRGSRVSEKVRPMNGDLSDKVIYLSSSSVHGSDVDSDKVASLGVANGHASELENPQSHVGTIRVTS